MVDTAITAILDDTRALLDGCFEEFLPATSEEPQRLHQAMHYAVHAGGKRLRPALVLASARSLGGDDAACRPLMAAVEFLHTYTLVHDDLPAMDDDDLRRGQPSCHKAFDEATAILCGDALLTLAMDCCACHSTAAVHLLSAASGSRGVVGGQQDDLDAGHLPAAQRDAALLLRIQQRKTAALLRASCGLGALAAGADAATRTALEDYGQAIGIAFQITDDLLDQTADSQALGKTAGKDAEQNKLTAVGLFGIEQARQQAQQQIDAAHAALAGLACNGDTLRALADFILDRRS